MLLNNHMARAQLEYYPRLGLYLVIDSKYNHLVIQTSNYSVAHYWQLRVNQCRHPVPYDIVDHDRRVRALIAQAPL